MRSLGWTAVLLVLCGCGPEPAAVPPAVAPVAPVAPQVYCHQDAVPLSALDRPRPATGLSADGRAALGGAGVGPVGDLASWSIVEDTPARMTLIRELGAGTEGGAYRLLSAERPQGAATGGAKGGWRLRVSSRCDLHRVPQGLGAADVVLDPAGPAVTRDAREVRLLVTEQACASGADAGGRIRASVERTATEVRLTIGVAGAGGAQDCRGNPPTPYTADLGEPLGDRILVDASSHPPVMLART
ncbi:hypothetical protein [Actinocorallia longicatena]|uniref:Lipoprotein n=1 Tax=Actinocorallia longicatena TaxID=111803 RepID=A0ABP6Q0R6_9ACTN